MKNMRFPHNYKRRRFSVLGIAGIAVSVALVAVGVWRPQGLSEFLLAVTRPLHLAKTDVTAQSGAAASVVLSRRALQEENERLADELQKAEIKAGLFDELRGRVPASFATGTQEVSARVLSSPPFSPYDTLILDAGSSQGVSVGATVSYDGVVALGVVDSISERSSRVRLFSSPGSEQPVRIGSGDYLVSARGAGGGAFHIAVLKEEAVSRGDGVFLPDGQLLARVERVVPNEADAFVLVYAALPVSVFEIRDVVIISSSY